MTEFQRFWEQQDKESLYLEQTPDKAFAEKVWHAAQKAAIRTICDPPCIPEVGDKIHFLSLYNRFTSGETKEVTRITKAVLDVYYIESKQTREDGTVWFSSGILGEIEKVSDDT